MEHLKKYRADFRGTRVPTFLMSKEQLQAHKRLQNNLMHRGSAGPAAIEKHRATSMGLVEEKGPDASQESSLEPGGDPEKSGRNTRQRRRKRDLVVDPGRDGRSSQSQERSGSRSSLSPYDR